MKKVIAAVTMGKDVSSLFPTAVNCTQTDGQPGTEEAASLCLRSCAKSHQTWPSWLPTAV